jgi:hypothetical protein
MNIHQLILQFAKMILAIFHIVFIPDVGVKTVNKNVGRDALNVYMNQDATKARQQKIVIHALKVIMDQIALNARAHVSKHAR